jgi:hypothetical protein
MGLRVYMGHAWQLSGTSEGVSSGGALVYPAAGTRMTFGETEKGDCGTWNAC